MENRLLTFIAVAETGSFSLAAKKLSLTQPAVSQHVKQIESEYGIKLFSRSNGELLLTDEGEIVLRYAKRIQTLYKDMSGKLEDEKNESLHLRVGISNTYESDTAPEILAYYSRKKNKTRVSFVTDSIKRLYDRLAASSIDLAIIEGKITNKKFARVLLGSYSLVAVLSPNHPLASKPLLSIEEVQKEKLIVRSGEAHSSTLLESGLAKLDLSLEDFDVIVESDNLSSIKSLIHKNLGIAILPPSLIDEEIKDGSLIAVPIKKLDITRDTNLLYVEGNISEDVIADIVAIYQKKSSGI